METYPVLLIMAGIVAMDTTSGPQILVSEPVVSCSALGVMFGNPEIGLLTGMLFQMLRFGYKPLGAVQIIDSNMSAFISTASIFTAAEIFGLTYNTMKAAIIPVLMFGIIVGFIGLKMINGVRRLNGIRSESIRSRVKRGEISSISSFHMRGVLSSFLRGVLMAFVFIPAGMMICGLVRFLPSGVVDGMAQASSIIWGYAFASAIFLYWIKGEKRFLFIGSMSGFLWTLILLVQKG